MPKRIIGLIVACVLALFGGATVGVPAVAAPQESTAKTKAAQTKAAQTKAARAQSARTKAAVEDRWRNVVEAGPRAVAAARAASQARTRATAAVAAAARAEVAAAAAARRALAAKAKAVSVSKSKASAKTKAKAVVAAKAAVKAATKARSTAQKAAARAARARAVAAAKASTAADARLNYVAQAGPRSAMAAAAAKAAPARAKAAARAAAVARSKAVLAAQKAATARAKAVAVARSKASTKAKKKAAKQATSAARSSAKASARAQASAAAAVRAKAAIKSTKKAAAKAKKAAGPNASWAPRDSLVFNHPRGTRKQKLAIITQLNKAIDATPAGGQIRMAMYLFDIGSVSNKLIAAHRRGVSVQILIDDGESNKFIRKVRKSLGTNKKKRSFVATCDRGCMANGPSTIHAKFYLFSVAGKGRHVSMVSSANPYTGNTFKSWNNNHMIVGDKRIYGSLSKYFTDMLADQKNLNYYRVTASGKYALYLYPQKVRRPQDVVLLNVLNHTTCRKTAKGYGSEGRTLVRVANWGWTGARIDVAKRLWKLHDNGCKVQAIVNKGRISRSVLKVLLKKSKNYGQMKVYDAWYDGNNNDIAGLYLHHKTLTINGLLSGRNVKVTWTGSQNLTSLATVSNNDILLRVADASVTDDYNTNFAYIRDHYTKRMRTVPLVTRIVRR